MPCSQQFWERLRRLFAEREFRWEAAGPSEVPADDHVRQLLNRGRQRRLELRYHHARWACFLSVVLLHMYRFHLTARLSADNPGAIVVRGGEVRGTRGAGVLISAKSLSSAAIRFEGHRIVNVATGNISVRPCPPRLCFT